MEGRGLNGTGGGREYAQAILLGRVWSVWSVEWKGYWYMGSYVNQPIKLCNLIFRLFQTACTIQCKFNVTQTLYILKTLDVSQH